MDKTAKILRDRMKDRHENVHTVCWSGEKTGKEAEEKQNKGTYRSVYEYDALCTEYEVISIVQFLLHKNNWQSAEEIQSIIRTSYTIYIIFLACSFNFIYFARL